MKPLTDDEIEELFDIAVSDAWNSPSAYPFDIVPLMFARAIESHHGIQDRQSPEA